MHETLEKRLRAVTEWLQSEYAGIRTGQATPALLDSVRVEQYGTLMPLVQVGSVGVEDARTLRVSPWDAGAVASIERAIKDADLGVSVATDSSGLRVIFPELSSERRAQLLKLAKAKLEEARVRVRSARDDAMKEIEANAKQGGMGEDQKFKERDQVQKRIDAANKNLEDLCAAKEREISA